MITGLSHRNHRVIIPHLPAGAGLELCHHHTTWSQWASWREKVQDQPYSSWWQLPEPWCITGTVLLLSPPWQVSAESFDSFSAPKQATASQAASSATPSPQAGLRSEAHPNDHGASYSYAERERDITQQSVTLTSLGIPSDSSRGCSRPQWSSKCLNMKLLAYSVASQKSQSLVCQSIVSGKRTSPGYAALSNSASPFGSGFWWMWTHTQLFPSACLWIPQVWRLWLPTLHFRTGPLKPKSQRLTWCYCREPPQPCVLTAGPGKGMKDHGAS